MSWADAWEAIIYGAKFGALCGLALGAAFVTIALPLKLIGWAIERACWRSR